MYPAAFLQTFFFILFLIIWCVPPLTLLEEFPSSFPVARERQTIYHHHPRSGSPSLPLFSPNPGKHWKIVSTIAFSGSARIRRRGGRRSVLPSSTVFFVLPSQLHPPHCCAPPPPPPPHPHPPPHPSSSCVINFLWMSRAVHRVIMAGRLTSASLPLQLAELYVRNAWGARCSFQVQRFPPPHWSSPGCWQHSKTPPTWYVVDGFVDPIESTKWTHVSGLEGHAWLVCDLSLDVRCGLKNEQVITALAREDQTSLKCLGHLAVAQPRSHVTWTDLNETGPTTGVHLSLAFYRADTGPPIGANWFNYLGGPNGLLPLAHQNRAVTESFGKSDIPGPNISVICPGICRVTEIQITSWPSKKEFFTSHFCDLYRSCVASRKSFLRLHFLIFWFSDFLISEAGAKKRPKRRTVRGQAGAKKRPKRRTPGPSNQIPSVSQATRIQVGIGDGNGSRD